ncbi:N-acetyltransferase [Klenkia sp. PcliD-1-E]|uniref:GNAT family N-acetyltransferase n=1 Tax=Klenkia sp. PcliD-1-E TaxID=2954492 RepID=UPI0020973421|nr:GNAT family N-acetyltransferase [Klenkia sp. PcliD-1-E]MCO7220944.1 GNAT family N-acetyltransferase [Klenkia sp. PcliD-1-E]
MEVRPLALADLDALAQVLGPTGRRADSCWCQRFRRHDEPDNRSALEAEVRAAPVPVGLLAVDDGPVGWTRVVPRAGLPGITGNRALARLLDDDPSAWWVACVAVRRDARGRGVGAALLRAAATWAAEHGASVLDGHPVDTALGGGSPSALFTGTRSMFERAGFTEFGRTYRTRPVMRRDLR